MQKNIFLTLVFITTLALNGCQYFHKGTPGMYEINKTTHPITIDANWDKEVWANIPALDIKLYMGDKPEHLPKTQAKLLYDDQAIYVIFRVEDQYVRAVANETHGEVWKDSCVEFFFTPDQTIDAGYFNLEMNCGGTFLLHHNTKDLPRQELELSDCQQIQVATTLPKNIDPEITQPTTWCVEYRLPINIIENYANVAKPAPGVIWRANFYKCADQTSHPHWLTWNKVNHPTPNFHLPKYFGQIIFK